ncbi:MAG: alpha-glucosidase/alpha-galactosidase [Phycisphaerae bacterium]
MIKVAMIGAGSVVFSRNLTGDILSYPEFRDATFSYMDIDRERLEVGAALCRKVAKGLGGNPTIEATMDRRTALAGADFVINMVQIGGMDSTLVDFEIPRKYGLNFTIADTTGPGGLFRALRTYPLMKGLAQDMQELCPRAVLLNYSNPMSMNMQTVTRTSNIQAVGLCHSVQGTLDQIMRYIGEDPHTVEFICAGINHMAFYIKLMKNGQDLYPRLFQAMQDPKVYGSNQVRFELMKILGHFITESSEHNAEYCPYFIPRGRDVIAKHSVPIDEYLRRCDGIIDDFERMQKEAQNDDAMKHTRSHEYGSTIIHSIVTGTPSVVYGNMPNRGAITNLPATAIVEVPTLVDRAGLQFTTVGELPPQLVAYMMPHVQQHELFIRAAMEGRRDHVYQAAMFDPLTAATLTLDKIVEMCDEMIAAHGPLLPDLDAKRTLVPNSGIAFPLVDPKVLHASWDKKQQEEFADCVDDWHVIGPFAGIKAGAVSLDDPTPVDPLVAASPDGSLDVTQSVTAGGQTWSWVPAKINNRGMINLGKVIALRDWVNAFAYTTVESIHARECVCKMGSDDGIRVWINGKLVHNHEIGRGYSVGADTVTIQLRAGINHIVVKCDNYRNGWGFGMMIPKANF